jgi:hypothetical protein
MLALFSKFVSKWVLSRVRALNACVHEFDPWGHAQELPIWDVRPGLTRGQRSIGYQPTERKLYQDMQGRQYEKVIADLDWILVGKVIEQRRSCRLCGFTELNKMEWGV